MWVTGYVQLCVLVKYDRASIVAYSKANSQAYTENIFLKLFTEIYLITDPFKVH